jgi:hypothetical protein
MNSRHSIKLSFLGVLAGSVIALAEGLAQLACARTPTIIIVVAAGFAAGASLTAFVAEFRGSRRVPPA